MNFVFGHYVSKVGNTVRSASSRKKALFIGLFGKRPSFQVFSSSNKMWYFLELLKNISKNPSSINTCPYFKMQSDFYKTKYFYQMIANHVYKNERCLLAIKTISGDNDILQIIISLLLRNNSLHSLYTL